MMKINNFDKYWKDLKLRSVKFRAKYRKGRLPGRRPRNEEDRRTLMLVDKMRWERKLKSKEIVIVGPGKYVFNI
jgi:hypothetical protein